eukprot:1064255-Pyramimonas_sp.AAC.1
MLWGPLSALARPTSSCSRARRPARSSLAPPPQAAAALRMRSASSQGSTRAYFEPLLSQLATEHLAHFKEIRGKCVSVLSPTLSPRRSRRRQTGNPRD